jgi:hypothetical protein
MSAYRLQDDALPCDNCPSAGPLAARLAMMDARIERIEEALYGDGKARNGVAKDVETLIEISKVGRSTIRVFMWFGGAVVGIVTLAWQFKQAIQGLIH